MHIVLRSSQARGLHSFLRHDRAIAGVIKTQSKAHFVEVFAVANAGNHLHFLVRARARECLSNFLRALTGRIAQLVGHDKTGASNTEASFWDARPFSRIVAWGRDFKNVARYIALNSTEMLGMARTNVTAMFDRIRRAIEEGRIPRNPELIAAGFV